MRRPTLDAIASVVVILAGSAVLVGYARPYFTPKPKPPYSVGDALDLGLQGPAFLLYTASTCRFCTDSMPLYRKMQENGARIVALTAESIEANGAYLRSHGVQPETILSMSEVNLRLRGTPALLLIDQSSTVQGAWYGRQSEAGQADILRRIQ